MASQMTGFEALFKQGPYRHYLPDEMFCRGFIFAVATSPDIPMPERWMPWLISVDCHTPDTLSFGGLAEGLMDGLRDVLLSIRNALPILPDKCQWATEASERNPLTHWLTGLLTAHRQLESVWQEAWSLAQRMPEKDMGVNGCEDPAKRLSRCLKVFTILADPDAALKQCAAERAAQLRTNLPTLAAQLPGVLKEYVTLAGELAAVLPDQFETFVYSGNRF